MSEVTAIHHVPTGSSTATPTEPWVGAFVAGMAGWTLDAFDFFLVMMALTSIGHQFGQSIPHMALAAWITLVLRPVGAFFFGGISDLHGRRLPLMINLCLFAVIEVATGFAPNFTVFLIIRAVFGIVMGGQWGIGVSLAMEKVPAHYRGILSGLLQQGYALGFLLAAGAYFTMFNRWGWRPLFFLGSIPALGFAIFVKFYVTESDTWKRNRQTSFAGLGRVLVSHWALFLYFIVFMMAMHMSSHGTQDMYPTFLEKDWGILGRQKAAITAISMVGAILGGLSIGWISDRIGRRRAMMLSLIGAVVIIPLWAFSHTLSFLILGAVLMQFFVQGAWGVVPAHVAELSPDSVRGSLPGMGNQIGVILSGGVGYLEASFAHNHTYASAMAITAAAVFTLAILMTLVRRDHRPASLNDAESSL